MPLYEREREGGEGGRRGELEDRNVSQLPGTSLVSLDSLGGVTNTRIACLFNAIDDYCI